MGMFRVLFSAMAVLVFSAGLALAASPEIVVLSPKDGSTVHPDPKIGPVVVVQYKVKNFEIIDFTKDWTISESKGHIHIQLDDQPFSTIHTVSNTWVYAGVKPGKHTITLELAHSNHTPLRNRVVKTINFTMAEK